MQIGVHFPHPEIGSDPGAVRAFGVAVEELGFKHILVLDHVIGGDPAVRPDWHEWFDHATPFHEPFVVLGYLAALTNLELATGVIILPQRQTVLVAKQAAEVACLPWSSARWRRFGAAVGSLAAR